MKEQEEKKRMEYLMGIVHNLPEAPGIYQYRNEEGSIIYVGKAKNLKRRVSSYFNKNQQSAKTRMLVSKIQDIRYIVVNTEEDALLLENNLIKRYKPRYNVLLKDDKTYPSLCVTDEYFPRIIKTRKRTNKNCTYFGPYSHPQYMYAAMDLIKKLYPLRTCRLVLTPEGIEKGKFKECLEYHIGNCKAPCTGKQSHEDYMKNIEEIKNILKGDTQIVSNILKDEMFRFSEELKFEDAQFMKERYELLENYRSKSEVVNSNIHNVDVFSIEMNEKSAYINYLHIVKGSINQAFTFEYRVRMNETKEELLQLGIAEMHERYKSSSKEIIIPFELDMEMDGVTFTIPQRGEKKHLLDLSIMNVKQYKLDRLKQDEKLNPEQKKVRILTEIKEQLHMDKMPAHIECFDNSNIQGSDPVAACVVFKMGKPSKKDYRKYNIKTVIGPDDYASMKEVVFRRYHRLMEEQQPLPDLIITDGGKGQMEVVREVVEGQLHLNIPIAGLAKDNHHRTNELLYGFPPQVIGIKQDTPLFHLLVNIQDEVHRFAITFHRDKRSKRQITSALDNIKGIGEKRKDALLKAFKSVARIKKASEEDVAKIIGTAAAKKVLESLNNPLL